VTRLKQGMTPGGSTWVPDQGPKPAEPGAQLSRSVTVPAPSNVDQINSAPLQRSKTTINVPANRNQGSRPGDSPPPPPAKLTRSATTAGRNPGTQQDLITPVRGLSIRANNQPPSMGGRKSSMPREQMAEFYDDYLDAYSDQPPAPAPLRRSNTVASWARNNANPGNAPPSRVPSMRAPPSSYSGGGGVRRRGTSVGRQRSVRRNAPSYEEEEEGYGSGGYDDGSAFSDFSKVRVKVRFKDEVRGLAIAPDVSFAEFMGMLSAKFAIPVRKIDVKFKDEDGGQVSMKDEMDFEMALETARDSAGGKGEGKLEVWCSESRAGVL